MKGKTLLMIGAGLEQIPAIERAKELGIFTVVTDGSVSAPGVSCADEFLKVSTYDVENTVKRAKEFNRSRKIDGVIAVGADVPKSVAAVASALGLSGVSREAAELVSDKLKMKEKFAECGVPVPWFSGVKSFNELKRIIKDRGYPLVIKPVDSRGARGVLLLTEKTDLKWAFDYALSFSPARSVIVEEFVSGPQVSTESVILNGRAYTPGFTDRNYESLEKFAPFMIENGGTQPTMLSNEIVHEIDKIIEKASATIGITNGVVKGDIVVSENGAKIIEIAARLSGGWFSTVQIPLSTGVDFLGNAYKLALGEKIETADLLPKKHDGCAIRYWFPKPGKLIAIKGEEQLKKMTSVKKYGFFVKIGEYIKKTTNHTERAGFVITVGKDRDESIKFVNEALNTVEFVVG